MVEKLIHLSRCADTSIKKNQQKGHIVVDFFVLVVFLGVVFVLVVFVMVVLDVVVLFEVIFVVVVYVVAILAMIVVVVISIIDIIIRHEVSIPHCSESRRWPDLQEIWELVRTAAMFFYTPPPFQPYSHSHLVFLQV